MNLKNTIVFHMHEKPMYVCMHAHVLCQGPQPKINKSITISLKLEMIWEIQGRYLCSTVAA